MVLGRFNTWSAPRLGVSNRGRSSPFGKVGVKFSYLDGHRRAAPEYEDCARLAKKHQIPLLSVYEAARAAVSEE